jgi:putative ABC transport system permease protein
VGPNQQPARLFTVVGVVDERRAGVSGGRDAAQRIFVPAVRQTGHLLIRTDGPAQPVIPLIRSAANAEVPELPLVSAATLEARQSSERRTIVQVITALGGGGLVALFLSAIGLYAVVAFAVGQRTREIGIRTALGAGRRQVVGMFVVRGLRLGLAGLALGLTLSVAVVRIVGLAAGTEPQHGIIGLAALVASIVIGVALLAAWIPARRAARIDPLDALRVE